VCVCACVCVYIYRVSPSYFFNAPLSPLAQVVRKVLFEPADQYERPNEDARVEIRYIVRMAGDTCGGTGADTGGGTGGDTCRGTAGNTGGGTCEDTGGGTGAATGRNTGGGTAGNTGGERTGAVLYTTGEKGVFVTQGDSSVLPCIDAAVREMKKGERALVSATAVWAYGGASGGSYTVHNINRVNPIYIYICIYIYS